jgi:hypothetical protein
VELQIDVFPDQANQQVAHALWISLRESRRGSEFAGRAPDRP